MALGRWGRSPFRDGLEICRGSSEPMDVVPSTRTPRSEANETLAIYGASLARVTRGVSLVCAVSFAGP